MKKFFVLLISIFCILCLTSCDEAIDPLDEINSYQIYISPTEEGNLKLQYSIAWHVLNSDKEGPLEWVKIGVPNQYISNLTKESSSIKKISYYGYEGAYVRLDLDRQYEKDEVVLLEFSFLQKRIYTLEDDKVMYRFIPGWFDEIRVKNLTVYWEKDAVQYQNSSSSNSNYYIWEAALDFGESIEVDVQYSKDHFINLSNDNTYSSEDGDNTAWIILSIIVILCFVFLVIGIIAKSQDDGYYSHRGFTGRSFYSNWFWRRRLFHQGVDRKGKKLENPKIVNGNHSHHSGGSSCACACACACAGGGRAGCSRKDFSHPDLEVNHIIKKLE